MDYESYAKNEFKVAGWLNEDDSFKSETQKNVCNAVLELLGIINRQRHSADSLYYAISMLSSLSRFEPLTELTGEDSEWVEVSDGLFKNVRCASVFKHKDRFDGQAYNTNGIIFWKWVPNKETGGLSKEFYSADESNVPITFPYIPQTKIEERQPK